MQTRKRANCFESYLDCIKKKEHCKPIKNIRKNMLYAYLEAFGLEDLYTKKNIFDTEGKVKDLYTKKNIFDTEGKVKDQYKGDYEKLQEVIGFDSKSLVPLKKFLERFVENNQK